MRPRQLSLCLLLTLGFTGSAHAAECHFDRTLAVSSNGSLDAHNGSGDLKIVSGDGSHVRISGRVRSSSGWFGGSNESDVQRICNNPPIEQNGSSVRVGQIHGDGLHNVSIDYTMEVPRAFNVSAESGSGDVEVRDLSGAVSVNAGSGNLHANHLSAGAKLGTGSGNIQAEELGGMVRLSTGSGDIQARFADSSDVRATTGSGGIRLENVRGSLNAHTGSGGIEASGKPSAFWQIDSSSGDVHLRLPQDAGFRLEASSSSGDIQSSLPLRTQGSTGRHNVQGQIGSGGPEVRVQTSSGSIRIE